MRPYCPGILHWARLNMLLLAECGLLGAYLETTQAIRDDCTIWRKMVLSPGSDSIFGESFYLTKSHFKGPCSLVDTAATNGIFPVAARPRIPSRFLPPQYASSIWIKCVSGLLSSRSFITCWKNRANQQSAGKHKCNTGSFGVFLPK